MLGIRFDIVRGENWSDILARVRKREAIECRRGLFMYDVDHPGLIRMSTGKGT